MEQLETLKRKIESAEDLHSVVKTMKTLAAVSIREYEMAVESLADYSRTIEMGIQIIMKNRSEGTITARPLKNKTLGAVIFGSSQGMVGQFNEQIVSYAIERMNDLQAIKEDRAIMALGDRVIARLEGEEQSIEEHFSIFGSLVDITSMMQEVLMKIEEWHQKREIGQIVLFYNKPASGTSYSPYMQYLLPLDLEWFRSLKKKEWPSHALPTFTMDWDKLFSSLIRQYFFVSLYRAFAESLASENASRLSSMQAAERNIEERLEELKNQFHQQRQSSITVELLDIVSGFEALSNEGGTE